MVPTAFYCGRLPDFVEVDVTNGGNSGYAHTTVPSSTGSGTFQIDWFTSRVAVYFNNALVFDSAVSNPDPSIPGTTLPLGAAFYPLEWRCIRIFSPMEALPCHLIR